MNNDVYMRKIALNGRELYFKNGKLTALAEIPEDAKIMDGNNEMAAEPSFDDEGVEHCIFGDGRGDCARFVNGVTVSLCEMHYQDTTLGEIVQHMRESQSE